MPTLAWILIAILALSAVWLAWRFVALRRATLDLAAAVKREPQAVASSESALGPLTRALREYAEASEGRLAEASSQRARLATVLDQLTDGVLIADADGVVSYSNPAAKKLFDAAQPLGRSLTEILRNHTLVEAWQRSRDRQNLQSATAELFPSQQFVQLVVIPDMHAGGSLLLVQDLTRVRRLETVRQDFVANFSHELRTPLASLRALAETLLTGALRDPEAAPRFLQRMITEVDALTQMSEELLTLTAIESGRTVLERNAVRVPELLDWTADRMRPQADRAGLRLRVEPAADLPELHADFGRLGQVLTNLLHNAIKFTPEGGEVVLSAMKQDAGVQFSVRDTGRGIPADDLPRIFERFYRSDRARSGGGTGLGLSIARHIIEAHGGSIWAESVEGAGSTFRFVIPSSG